MLFVDGEMVLNKTENFKVGGNYQFIVQYSKDKQDIEHVQVS